MPLRYIQVLTALTVLVLSVAACAPAKQYQAPVLTPLDAGRAQTIIIHADGDWQGAGIRVDQGEVYDLTASGRWSNSAIICGWTEADGAGASPLCRNDISGYGLVTHALIGKVGETGKPFQVGKSLRLTPTTSGVLYLKDYDDPNFYWDNEGSVTVTIAQAEVQTRRVSVMLTPTGSAPRAASASAEKATNRFRDDPIDVSFQKAPIRRDDIAVIIGNADYKTLGSDIPNVQPAYADAAGIKRYVTDGLGVREGNIILMRDATGAHMQRVFGTLENSRGQLFDWVKPGLSRVFVYYAGHGAPVGADGSSFLVPSDADATRINLNGYPLSLLYRNLAKLPAQSVMVVLEACFSGASQAGSVMAKASPIFVKPRTPPVPKNLTVIAAGGADQMASWQQDAAHSLFTTYFLKGMSGDADEKPYGNGDGRVSLKELAPYLEDTLTYYARRYYGRDQTAQIAIGK